MPYDTNNTDDVRDLVAIVREHAGGDGLDGWSGTACAGISRACAERFEQVLPSFRWRKLFEDAVPGAPGIGETQAALPIEARPKGLVDPESMDDGPGRMDSERRGTMNVVAGILETQAERWRQHAIAPSESEIRRALEMLGA